MAGDGDWMRRFHLEQAGVRGVIARVDRAWREVRSHADYPPALAALLGECLAASALFAGNIKLAGSTSVQLRGSGAVRMVFAECTSQGELRGIARWQGEVPGTLEPGRFGGEPVLAITIDPVRGGQRYQGMVPLVGSRVHEAFEAYFAQSEQLPTAIRLAATDSHCTGMLVQQIAASGGTASAPADPLEYERVETLFRTLTDAELLALPAETLLRRLFAEDDVRLHGATALRFGCSCSRERVIGALLGIGREEAREALDASGHVEVTCEFCNRHYRVDAVELEQLFTGSRSMPGPDRPQ